MTTRSHLQYHKTVVPLLVERTGFKALKQARGKGAGWTLASFKHTAGFEPDDYETSAETFSRPTMAPREFILKSQEQKAYRVAHTVIMAPNFITHETQRMFPWGNGIDPVPTCCFVARIALFSVPGNGIDPVTLTQYSYRYRRKRWKAPTPRPPQ